MRNIVIIILVQLCSSSSLNEFQQWMIKQQKVYHSPIEMFYRQGIYYKNKNHILMMNSQNRTFTLGENEFMDLTDEEFIAKYLQREIPIDTILTNDNSNNENYEYPSSADHTSKMNSIKNQGTCSNGWAFSAVGAYEAYFIIKQDQKVTLSEQQLNDCDIYSSDGCAGGIANLGIDYLTKNGAVQESEYPYAGIDQKCKIPRGTFKAKGRKSITVLNEVYASLAEYPISVNVHAGNWKLYQSGVFDDCINTSTNHAAVAVGYDENLVIKVRNSWGPAWGEQGHIRLAKGNTCGVLKKVDQVI